MIAADVVENLVKLSYLSAAIGFILGAVISGFWVAWLYERRRPRDR